MSLVAPTYGSDRSGLVCGYLFSPGGPGRSLDSAEAVDWLRRDAERKGGDFLWLHFTLANIAAEKWLRDSFALPDAFLDALHEGSRSTRIENADERLVAVINDALYDFSFGASDIATMWLSVDRHAVISARRKPLRSVDRLRASVNKGSCFGSPVELLVHLLHDQGDVLVQIVRDAVDKVDGIEDGLLADRLELGRVDLGAACWCGCGACWPPSRPRCSGCSITRPGGSPTTICKSSANPPSSSRRCSPTWRACWSGSSCCRRRSPSASTSRTIAVCSC
jgi:zinc transporter